ncbi:MAG TPA: type II secretion system minor pseudopilin GspK [Cellvibrio sp.]|nr:type II secretion system minor pseudopilin GspK [Cellvibrio sp.]
MRTEQGTVLVLVLLIVALVAALSVKFAAQYQLGLARAETRWHGAQARAFLEGTEEVAKLLFHDADQDESSDFLGEPWGSEVPIDDEGVSGVARLTDATTQLNLNDLNKQFMAEQQQGQPTRYSEPQRQFIRLLQTFPDMQLQQDQAECLLEAVVDWMDEDENESGQCGAESNFYQSMPEPYLPPNGLFKSVDELRLIRGFNENPLLVQRVMPFLTALPQPNIGMNINTIELVSPTGRGINNLLLAINAPDSLSPATEAEVQQAIKARTDIGYVEDAAVQNAFAGKDVTTLKRSTPFFWLNATVQLVDQRRSMRSLMTRANVDGRRTLTVIRREDVYELPSQIRREDEEDEDGETELVE